MGKKVGRSRDACRRVAGPGMRGSAAVRSLHAGFVLGRRPMMRESCQSCRGDAAGFAHPSCLIAYATTKSIQLKGCSKDQDQVWRKCPTCKQQFQNQLSLDLCSAYVTFAESTEGKKCVDIRNALEVNIGCITDILIERTKTMSIPLSRSGGKDKVLSAVNISIRDNGIKMCDKLLSLVLQQKNDNKNTKYMSKIMHWEADTYESFGFLHNLDQTREAGEIALKYLERAQVIYKLLPDNKDNLHHVITNAVTKANLKELGGQRTAVDTLDHITVEERRKGYECHKQQFGENDTSTISTGIDLIAALLEEKCYIEATRHATKIRATSRQVLGLDHGFTKRAEEMLNKCQARFICVPDIIAQTMSPDKCKFQALQYDDVEDVYVVMGPISEPRNVKEEREHRFARHKVMPELGWPVVCCGLKGSSHLNGKLGELKYYYNANTKRRIDLGMGSAFSTNSLAHIFQFERDSFRVTVYFKDKTIPPAAVKLENLRIVFEVPDEMPGDVLPKKGI